MFNFVLWIFIIIGIIFLPFIISMIFWFLYFYFKFDYRLKKGEHCYIGYGSKIKRLFVEFPKQFIIDNMVYI